MKNRIFFIAILIALNLFAGCNQSEKKQSAPAKYQFTDSGENATGTRSFVISRYLSVDSINKTAIYLNTENGDVIGGIKKVYTVKQNGEELELYYKSCIGFEFLGAEETECTEQGNEGEKQFIFKKVKAGLELTWSIDNDDKQTYEEVEKFDFEE